MSLNCILDEQHVTLTGRNTTGPPWSVGRPRARRPAVLQATTDDDRRRRPLLVWPTYTASMRASYNVVYTVN